MAESSDRIEQEIYRKREKIGEDLDDLQSRIKRTVDWRAQVEDHPFTMLGVAFAGGLLAAALFGNTRVSRRIRRRSARQWERAKSRVEQSARRAASEWGDKVASAFDNAKESVVSIAAAKVMEYLDEFLPGVRERYYRERCEDRGRYDGGEHLATQATQDTAWQRSVSGREAGYARQSS